MQSSLFLGLQKAGVGVCMFFVQTLMYVIRYVVQWSGLTVKVRREP